MDFIGFRSSCVAVCCSWLAWRSVGAAGGGVSFLALVVPRLFVPARFLRILNRRAQRAQVESLASCRWMSQLATQQTPCGGGTVGLRIDPRLQQFLPREQAPQPERQQRPIQFAAGTLGRETADPATPFLRRGRTTTRRMPTRSSTTRYCHAASVPQNCARAETCGGLFALFAAATAVEIAGRSSSLDAAAA